MKHLHGNPHINELFNKYLKEDGTISLPKDAEEQLWQLVSEDFARLDGYSVVQPVSFLEATSDTETNRDKSC